MEQKKRKIKLKRETYKKSVSISLTSKESVHVSYDKRQHY